MRASRSHGIWPYGHGRPRMTFYIIMARDVAGSARARGGFRGWYRYLLELLLWSIKNVHGYRYGGKVSPAYTIVPVRLRENNGGQCRSAGFVNDLELSYFPASSPTDLLELRSNLPSSFLRELQPINW